MSFSIRSIEVQEGHGVILQLLGIKDNSKCFSPGANSSNVHRQMLLMGSSSKSKWMVLSRDFRASNTRPGSRFENEILRLSVDQLRYTRGQELALDNRGDLTVTCGRNQSVGDEHKSRSQQEPMEGRFLYKSSRSVEKHENVQQSGAHVVSQPESSKNISSRELGREEVHGDDCTG